jgi:hypothetical protein
LGSKGLNTPIEQKYRKINSEKTNKNKEYLENSKTIKHHKKSRNMKHV